jgi:hypothetical protein
VVLLLKHGPDNAFNNIVLPFFAVIHFWKVASYAVRNFIFDNGGKSKTSNATATTNSSSTKDIEAAE